MKLKSSIMGLALAGAVALCSSAPAQAQQRPIEPYYFTPKILYSHTNMDSFEANGRLDGEHFRQHKNEGTGRYSGGDTHDKSFGGGASIGYDFGAYSEYPIRLELEYLHRGNVNASYPTKTTVNNGIDVNGDLVNGPNTLIASSNYHVKSTIQTVMANAFLDFPTDTAFTPYVGGGIGGAYVNSTTSGYTNLIAGANQWAYREGGPLGTYPIGAFKTDAAAAAATESYLHSYDLKMGGQQSGWNFAWQLSAGFSYQINDSMALDASYRYSDFGNADFGTNGHKLMGRVVEDVHEDSQGGAAASDGPVKGGKNTEDKVLGTFDQKANYDLSAHEVILGLRIMAF